MKKFKYPNPDDEVREIYVMFEFIDFSDVPDFDGAIEGPEHFHWHLFVYGKPSAFMWGEMEEKMIGGLENPENDDHCSFPVTTMTPGCQLAREIIEGYKAFYKGLKS